MSVVRSDRIMVFAPSPELTVTVEDRGGEPDLHLHAGGQGIWQARMIVSLGMPVALCGAFGGETGAVLRHLVADDGLALHAFDVAARNGGYVHDRRNGERTAVAEMGGDPLSRHELDGLYELALVQGIEAGVAVLSGPTDPRTCPAEIYRRLACDLSANGCAVFADLSGGMLDAVLQGGPRFVKVSHEELLEDGRATEDSPEALVTAMRGMRDEGVTIVVVSRAAEPALALLDDGLYEVRGPTLEPVDTRGAGDSMTGAVAACVAQGDSWTDALRIGAAAGALNVTRRGLATAHGDDIRLLAQRVELHRVDEGR